MKLSEEYCEGWCNENGGKGEFKDCTGCQIHKLEAQLAAVRAFSTSHIHLEDGEVFIKVRRDAFQAAIGEVSNGT